MSLGSIAHLQYYFARTGLLDGKGAQLAHGSRKKGEKPIPLLTVTGQGGEPEEDLVASPEDMAPAGDLWEEPVMLPPTVSTYSHRTHYIEPPPDMKVLKKDLREALASARDALEAADQPAGTPLKKRQLSGLAGNFSGLKELVAEEVGEDSSNFLREPRAWHEVQGVYILDFVTLAIRAARIYYTSHEHPERLATIKSERKIREELMAVLDVLQRWAGRNFVNGLKDDERAALLNWLIDVGKMLDAEGKIEELEIKERSGWTWVGGDWTGREYEREHAFLASLEAPGHSLPPWTPAEHAHILPSPFLEHFRDGKCLVRLHNQAVKKSARHFGEIKSFHEDTAKPYRCADNLRYWIKAAEIRWDLKLEVDVMGVVYDASANAWKRFDAALMKWCRGVREELVRDWKGESSYPDISGGDGGGGGGGMI